MPAKSEKQRRFMGAELSRKRAGKKTKTHMTEDEMEKMAMKSPKQRIKAKIEKMQRRGY